MIILLFLNALLSHNFLFLCADKKSLHPKVAVLFRIFRNHGIHTDFSSLKLDKKAEKPDLNTMIARTTMLEEEEEDLTKE